MTKSGCPGEASTSLASSPSNVSGVINCWRKNKRPSRSTTKTCQSGPATDVPDSTTGSSTGTPGTGARYDCSNRNINKRENTQAIGAKSHNPENQ